MKRTALKEAREARGLTQRELAKLLGVQEQTVSKWENGKSEPLLFYRNQLSEILTRSLKDLELSHENSEEMFPLNQNEEKRPSKVLSFAQHPDSNRNKMIQRVQNRWIFGILEHSLYKNIFLLLGFQERPDIVENPWKLVLQESSLPAREVPLGTSLLDIYDEMNGELLLLGEPGSGKTTLLLELARTLLVRAEEDTNHPIPVIFNLSSWAEKRQPLALWLLDELNTKYQIPVTLGKDWLESDSLLFLFDGFDEVDLRYRHDCIKAINAYRQTHGMVPLVVCSRNREYFEQQTHLLLHTAVVIQPLTIQQIEMYLDRAGKEFQEIRRMVHNDPILQELISTPLFLQIIVITQPKEILVGSLSQRRQSVLKGYVERVLTHRRPTNIYTNEQTIQYLTWLAQKMQKYSQTEFYLERLQPYWLSPRLQEQYRYSVIRIVFGLTAAINAGLYACFRGDSFPHAPGLFYWLGGGMGNSLLGWMSPGFGGGLQGSGSLGIVSGLVAILVTLLGKEKLPPLTRAVLVKGLLSGLRNGCIAGGSIGLFAFLVFAHAGGFFYGLYRGIGTALFGAFIFGLMGVFITLFTPEQENKKEIRLQNTREGSSKSRRLFSRLINILFFSLCAFLGFSCIYSLQSHGVDQFTLTYGSIIGIFFGIVYGVGDGTKIIHDLGGTIRPAEIVGWSWHSARIHFLDHVKRGIAVGTTTTIIMTVLLIGMSGSFYGWQYGLHFGLVYGLIFGLIASAASILTAILTSGWTSTTIEERLLLQPNEGIRRSLRNSFFAAGLFGPLGGVVSGLVGGAAFGFLAGLPGWYILGTGLALVFGIVFAFQFFLYQGGISSLEHYILRGYLWHHGYTPQAYREFLDYATEHILLRKVGGGYMFVHRLLLEYFAQLEKERNF